MKAKTTKPRILIIEPLCSLAEIYSKRLKQNGLKSDICLSGREAVTELRKGDYDVALISLSTPDKNCLEIIEEITDLRIGVKFVILTAQGSLRDAVFAIRKGAYDFLVTPVSDEQLLKSIDDARKTDTKIYGVGSREDKEIMPNELGFIGRSLPIQVVKKTIKKVANSQSPVFITGESGTGKEVTAEAIHRISKRRDNPFIAINCAALPENLIESEIFGHVKGAFTGAESARKGAAGQARGGTLFLDEICEMDINLQAKLLRFLQTGQIKRVGSDWSEHVDVRIICATNRNPRKEVAAKRFREDLFYRLNVLSIELPALSQRGRDVILLCETFLQQYSLEEGKHFKSISAEAISKLLNYNWPGNIRELQNVIRKAVVVHDGIQLEAHMINLDGELELVTDVYEPIQLIDNSVPSTPLESLKTKLSIDIHQPMSSLEQQLIEAVIESCNGSVPKASQILEISASTIYRKRDGWLATKLANDISKITA